MRVEHTQGQTLILVLKVSGSKCTLLVDTGATHTFVSKEWVDKHGIRCQKSNNPLNVSVADGRTLSSHEDVQVNMQVKGLKCKMTMKVLDLDMEVDGVLGLDWMIEHHATLDIPGNCLHVLHNTRPVTLVCRRKAIGTGLSSLHDSSGRPDFVITEDTPIPLTAREGAKLLKQGCQAWIMNIMEPRKEVKLRGTKTCSSVPIPPQSALLSELQATSSSATISDKLGGDWQRQVDDLLTEYADVGKPLDGPPEYTEVVHSIHTVPGARPPRSRMWRMTQQERAECEKQVSEMLRKKWIQPSTSPYGANVLFVQKKDKTLRMVVDWRGLNSITIRDNYPLPRIDDLIDSIGTHTSVFSCLDLQNGYHQLPLAEEHMHKTAFMTPSGLFEMRVLGMGLVNSASSFQRQMNACLHDYIKAGFVLVYQDDILILSRTPEEHLRHCRLVLQRLREKKLRIKLSKCRWFQHEIQYLGYIVSADGVKPDPEKIRTVQTWPVPKDVSALRGFLGLANYFSKFIKNYSTIAGPLTELTGLAGKTYDWQRWKPRELSAFDALKKALTEAPVLALPDFSKPFTVMTDASNNGCGAVLMQNDRPIAYTSKKFSSAERNYTTGEQETLGLIHALKVWRCYLEGPDVVMLTDHKPLTFLKTQGSLSRRQARWLEYMSRFHLDIWYKKGSENIADVLSRHPGFLAAVQTRRMSQNEQRKRNILRSAMLPPTPAPPPVTPPTPVQVAAQDASAVTDAHDQEGREGNGNDTATNQVMNVIPGLATKILDAYTGDQKFQDREYIQRFSEGRNGLYMYNGRIAIPNNSQLREEIISLHHDSVWAGHRGVRKTLKLVERYYWWDSLAADVRKHVISCDLCQRMKSLTKKADGLGQPLFVPDRPWQSVSFDMITGLPKTNKGWDAILVFVDRLTKYCYFVPCLKAWTSKDFAESFVENILARHGCPEHLVSDRGTIWVNTLWDSVCKLLGMQHGKSSSYRPQTDGQTEVMNRVLEDVLRHYVEPHHEDWHKWLPMAQFAVNNSWHETIQNTPFYLNHGLHPRTPATAGLLTDAMPDVKSLVDRIQGAISTAKRCYAVARNRYNQYNSKGRNEVQYKYGDRVLLSTANMRPKQGVKKLMPRWVGPFAVEQMVGPVAVRLQLTHGFEKLHNVFHVSKVKPYVSSGNASTVAPLPVEWVDGDPVYVVDSILEHKQKPATSKVKGKRQQVPGKLLITAYKVRWLGFSSDYDSWEPCRNLSGARHLVQTYWEKHNLSVDTHKEVSCGV